MKRNGNIKMGRGGRDTFLSGPIPQLSNPQVEGCHKCAAPEEPSPTTGAPALRRLGMSGTLTCQVMYRAWKHYIVKVQELIN